MSARPSDMTPDELVLDKGRGLATEMIENVVMTSKTNDEVVCGLAFLRASAVHILASHAYNEEKLNGGLGDDELETLFGQCEDELAFLREMEQEGEMETITAPDRHDS